MWLRPHRVLYLVGLLRLYRSTCPQYSRLKLDNPGDDTNAEPAGEDAVSTLSDGVDVENVEGLRLSALRF